MLGRYMSSGPIYEDIMFYRPIILIIEWTKKKKKKKKKSFVSSLKKENSSWTIELTANLGQFVFP
jgi:hypothetical protein